MDLIYDQAVNQYLHPDRYPNNIGKKDDLLILEKVPESYQALDAHLMSPANKKVGHSLHVEYGYICTCILSYYILFG